MHTCVQTHIKSKWIMNINMKWLVSKMKVAQSCPTLCDSTNYAVHEIFHAIILKWVAFPFTRGSSQPRDRTHVSCIAGRLFTNWAMKETHIKYIIVDIIYMIYQIYNVYEIYNYIYEIYNYKIFRKK